MKVPTKKAILSLILTVPFLAGGAVFATGSHQDNNHKDCYKGDYQLNVQSEHSDKDKKCHDKCRDDKVPTLNKEGGKDWDKDKWEHKKDCDKPNHEHKKDVCKNIEGKQESVPENYTEKNGVCTEKVVEVPEVPKVETPKVETPVVETPVATPAVESTVTVQAQVAPQEQPVEQTWGK